MIACKELGKCFKTSAGEIWPVRSVSMEAGDGEFISVVGRSGSGKTTLLKMLGGILKPDRGTVLINGEDMYARSEKEQAALIRENIAFVFQDYFLEENLTAAQNIEIMLMIRRVPDGERPGMIDSALERVGLTAKKNEYVRNLSGGEKQRTCIARAMVAGARILLCDEPCGNLDYENSRQIMKLLREQAAAGSTVILITHDLEDASSTDRMVTLLDGEIVS